MNLSEKDAGGFFVEVFINTSNLLKGIFYYLCFSSQLVCAGSWWDTQSVLDLFRMKHCWKETDLLWTDFTKDRQTQRDRHSALVAHCISGTVRGDREKAFEKLPTCDPYLSYWQLGFGLCICRHTTSPWRTQDSTFVLFHTRIHTHNLYLHLGTRISECYSPCAWSLCVFKWIYGNE